MQAQRACLDHAAALVRDVQGPVLELGLGNGRTYDHLRELLPDREIFVFERKVAAHPDCIPDERHLILGDAHDTLPGALKRIGAPAALTHSDMGTGDAAANADLAAFLAPQLRGLSCVGAVLLSDQEMADGGWQLQALPDGVAEGRYFIYRAV